MSQLNLPGLLPVVIDISERAATLTLDFYHNQEALKIITKDDGSPVTEADQATHELIITALEKLTPKLPVLSEEAANISPELRRSWPQFWLVDPIDGTKEFLAKTGDYTVNIALIDGDEAVLGVIAVPMAHTVYYAASNEGAWRKDPDGQMVSLHTRPIESASSLKLIGSRRHGKKIEAALPNHQGSLEFAHRGSSLKFCLIAEGSADLYPRLGYTSEWDTAAGQCILEQAGGVVLDLSGQRLRYNTKAHLENPYFLAAGDEAIATQSLSYLRNQDL